ncbi:hypothetical protein L1887_20752 [Cichorium endivia]|nr:hypothetical protein L1887_20752 [Cichorium endivia]
MDSSSGVLENKEWSSCYASREQRWCDSAVSISNREKSQGGGYIIYELHHGEEGLMTFTPSQINWLGDRRLHRDFEKESQLIAPLNSDVMNHAFRLQLHSRLAAPH